MKIADAVLLALSVCALATEKPKVPPASGQSAAETLDLDTIARIRDEGFNHSHIMEYASGLFDGIGPRLTGSPDFAKAEQWSLDQLRRVGADNVHSESWGEFGMGWQQIGTSVQMTEPGPATFLAQATPWSPATAGEVTAQVIAIPSFDEGKDFDKWKGKLAGKIILYGNAPKINPNPPPFEHYDAAKLEHLRSYPLDGDQSESYVDPSDPAEQEKFFQEKAFLEKVGHFFADEHAIAVLRPGGSGGVLHDDAGFSLGWFVYRPEHKQAIPSAVIADEAFGRIHRLVSHDVPVSVRLNIATRFTGDDHVQGENVIADIPGTDPTLKDQVVMVGGHLDSWIAGTGATDDGAGAIIAIEAIRILRALNIQPRRTIRVGLWGGEEQGIFGSGGYVSSHLGTRSYSTKPEEQVVPEVLRQQTGAVTVKPDHAKFDAYFNADTGTGKFLGIFAEGNSAVASIFQQWAAPINDLGFTTVTLRNTGSTDHVSFDQVGLPGFQFIQDARDYESRSVHSNLDAYERLSEPDLKQAAVIMAIFLYNTAQRDAMLPRKPLPHPELNEQRAKPLEGIYRRGEKQ